MGPRRQAAEPQLANDCFAIDQPLLPVKAALVHLQAVAQPVTALETIALEHAQGRILAQPVIAARAVPPCDNAAVDGFAVRHQDLDPQRPTRLPVVMRISAGDRPASKPLAAAAARIFTGAPMPPAADTVFMQEDCQSDGDHVILPAGLKIGANRRCAGEDIAAGDCVLPAGRQLRPQELGIAASLGLARLSVHRRLRVALFSTGDELCQPGEIAGDGQIYDSNRQIIAAMLQANGFVVDDLGILGDDFAGIRDALSAAAESHDAVITSGGVSGGEEDHVKRAVSANGQIHLWRIAIKPGRPLAMGQLGTVPFIGLPGNPVAVMVTYLRFARPLLSRLAGGPWSEPIFYPLPADFTFRKKPGRREYLRVTLRTGADGQMRLDQVPGSGSGILTTMAAADGLVELDDDCTMIAPGDLLNYVPFTEVMR